MEAGDRIDGWVVEARLGSGGMGSVYRCRNASTERIVAALKVLDRSLRSNPDASTRFVREAEILAGLDHPNIVRVRNVRVDADPPYLEMEFVEGEALDAVIRRGPAGYTRARHLLLQLADAVAYLHARGVRHRDLKPANVLVDPSDRVRLVDFGLATETTLERITEEGLNFGTVSYAPPEWMDPERLDPVQWDLYALGVVFHELLTGSIAYPMSGEGAVKKQLLQVMMNKQVAPPLDPGPAFPDPVRRLVSDLTRIDPAERPQTATDVCARLRALPDVAPGADGATAPPAASRAAAGPQSLVATLPPRSPRRWLLPAVALLALGTAAATAVVLVPWGPTPPGEVRPPPSRAAAGDPDRAARAARVRRRARRVAHPRGARPGDGGDRRRDRDLRGGGDDGADRELGGGRGLRRLSGRELPGVVRRGSGARRGGDGRGEPGGARVGRRRRRGGRDPGARPRGREGPPQAQVGPVGSARRPHRHLRRRQPAVPRGAGRSARARGRRRRVPAGRGRVLAGGRVPRSVPVGRGGGGGTVRGRRRAPPVRGADPVREARVVRGHGAPGLSIGSWWG
jgi:hypothetical protein